MSQSSSVDSDAPTLHPALRAALSCLDASLDDELARLRHSDRLPDTDTPRERSRRLRDAIERLDEAPASPGLDYRDAAITAEDTSIPEFVSRRRDVLHDSSSIVRQPDAIDGEPLPEDYLESSEQLLRDLDYVEAAQPTEPVDEIEGEAIATEKNSFLTPLGVGALAILLLSGTLLGAVAVNSNFWGRLTGLEETSEDPSGESEPPAAEPPPASDPPLPSGQPDLAREGTPALDPDPLGDSEAPGEATGNAVPAPPASEVPFIEPSDAEPTDDAEAASEAAAPDSTAAAPDPAQVAPAPQGTEGWIYVIADYSDRASLQAARAIVPEAFLIEHQGGIAIQLGAFRRQDEAASLIAELERQEISAEVYRP